MMKMRWPFALALVAGVVLCTTAAPASVDMSTGIRYFYQTGTIADCGAKAKTALDAYLQGTTESPPGSGEWIAYGPTADRGPTTSAAATVKCVAIDTGYTVTFDCVVQVPNNPYDASALCLDIAHNFSGKPVTPLATPTPPPSGCSTTNLVGTWVSDDRDGPTLQMTVDGHLTDADGVSGNWIIFNGNNVTLTYYGNHNLTLSADGKHLSGSGYHFTRKC